MLRHDSNQSAAGSSSFVCIGDGVRLVAPLRFERFSRKPRGSPQARHHYGVASLRLEPDEVPSRVATARLKASSTHKESNLPSSRQELVPKSSDDPAAASALRNDAQATSPETDTEPSSDAGLSENRTASDGVTEDLSIRGEAVTSAETGLRDETSPAAAERSAATSGVYRKSSLPLVAVIGRPNVGKSMLVNRISGTFRTGAVVEDTPGVTRDRTYQLANWSGRHFRVVDTGGLVFEDTPGDVFIPQIRQQALIALREADVVVLVVDGQQGVTTLDQDIAVFLRKTCDARGILGRRIPIVVAVNKCESQTMGEAQAAEFWELGLGQPLAISSIHGSGVAELLDEVCYYLPNHGDDQEEALLSQESGMRRVAIIGRPNVGKSSLLNALLGEERVIVSAVPGTTRDAIDELLIQRDPRTGRETCYLLIDTAGIRRKKNVEYGTEFFMINRAFKAIRRADVVLLVLDMEEGITDQDAELAERIVDEGKACVIVGNKWDALGRKDNRLHNEAQLRVRERLPVIHWADMIFVSAKTGQRIPRILALVDAAAAQHARRVSTAVLNEVLLEAVQWQAPPTNRRGQGGKIYYCTQVAVQPPTLALFVNDPELFPDTYKRYLERKFREALGFTGTPIRLLWRARKRRSKAASSRATRK
jgi:GTP-binding protein